MGCPSPVLEKPTPTATVSSESRITSIPKKKEKKTRALIVLTVQCLAAGRLVKPGLVDTGERLEDPSAVGHCRGLREPVRVPRLKR